MLNKPLLQKATANDAEFRQLLFDKIKLKCSKFHRELSNALYANSLNVAHYVLREFYRTSAPYLQADFRDFLKETLQLASDALLFKRHCQFILAQASRQSSEMELAA